MFGINWGQFKFIFLEQINGIYFSDLLMIAIVAALVSFVPGYILHIKKRVTVQRIILAFLTIAYAGVILMLTLFRRQPGSRSSTITLWLDFGFAGGHVYSLRQAMYSLLNVALFVPWGILLGLFRTKQRVPRIIIMTTLLGFISSFSIELIQLMTGMGKFELTDLVTNITGTFIGVFLVGVVIIIKRMAKNEQFKKQQQY
jgi:glycopeptide antibiotics resistance protein